MRIAAIDVDDTLAVCGPNIARVLGDYTKSYSTFWKWPSLSWKDVYPGFTPEELRDEVRRGLDYTNLGVTSQYWTTLLVKLHMSGLTPVFVSARRNVLGYQAHDVTLTWINEKLGWPATSDEVIITDHCEVKARLLKAQGYDVELVVEDSENEVQSYVDLYPRARVWQIRSREVVRRVESPQVNLLDYSSLSEIAAEYRSQSHVPTLAGEFMAPQREPYKGEERRRNRRR